MVYINHAYKFVFIENPKTGSTSLLQAFEKTLGIKIPRDPKLSHLTVEEVQRIVQGLEEYTWISTHRNPFKRWCSCMNYELHGGRYQTDKGKLIKVQDYNTFEKLEEHVMNPRDCVWCIPQELFVEGCHVVLELDQELQEQWETLHAHLGLPGEPVLIECKNFSKGEPPFSKEQLKSLYDRIFRG